MPAFSRSLRDRITGGVLAATWIVELGNLARPAPWLGGFAATGLVLFMVLALSRASKHVRGLFLIVLSTTLGLALVSGSARPLLDGLDRALVFGAFLPSVLLLRATVQNSARIASLRRAVGHLDANARSSWMLYGSHLLGAILNVGAMAVLAPISAASDDDSSREVLASASIRGVSTAVMWSPFFVAMGFVSHLIPGVRIESTMLLGVGLALIGLALSHAMFTRGLGWTGVRESITRLRPLVVPMTFIVGTVLCVVWATGFGGTQAVALGLPIICAAYLASVGRNGIRATASDTFRSFAWSADEMIIVVGSTVLGVAVAHWPLASGIVNRVPHLLAGALMVGALIVALVATGALGLHPMVGASILLPILGGHTEGVSDVVLVEAAVFAWGLSSMIAVWTLPVAVAASIFRLRVLRLSTGPNLRFGAVYLVCGILYLGLANLWMQ